MPYVSASAVVIHYEEALYQVYAPLPLPFTRTVKASLVVCTQCLRATGRQTDGRTDIHDNTIASNYTFHTGRVSQLINLHFCYVLDSKLNVV